MKVRDLILKNALKYKGKTAFIFEDRHFSFSQLQKFSFSVANYLFKRGIKKDEKVAIYLSNIEEAIFSYLGVFSIGGGLVPLDFMLTQEEIINFINHCEAKALITQPKKDLNLENIKSKCPSLKEIIICKEKIGGFTFFDDIFNFDDNEPEVEVNQEQLSSIFYTSGTTGHPKGVMLTYKHLDNPPEVINHFLGVTEKDIFLTGGVPFSHIGGLDYILLMLKFASKLIIMERFHPLEFLKNIQNYQVTIFCIVPAMYTAILYLKEYEKFNLSSLRYAVVFGAPSSPLLLQRFHKICPQAVLLNGWGMTETAAPNTFSPPDETKLNSIGKFGFNMQAKIVDDFGNPVLVREKGELWVKGDAVMAGYFKEPELTKEVLTEDGWLKTGDMAYFDEDGYIYLVGRKKDMIKVAGEIVFCAEVEEKISLYPKVKEVAVIGVSDNLRGEVPKAFIVPKETTTIDLQHLKDFLQKHLAHFKIPYYFEFVSELPKNRVGKIDKTKLKSEV
ncbi:MAG: AMP-binding protein [Candidatus Omnitrophica bacterium]|nr:AMP-binding protein [Candidatus Omnitrophota bacterium]